MRATLILLTLAALGGCSTQPSPTEGLVTVLDLQLLAPQQGSPGQPNTDRNATFNVLAYGDDGQLYQGDATVDLYVSYGGVLTGAPTDCGDASGAPIASYTVHDGMLMNQQQLLPVAYGSTSLWAEERGSHVVGASDPIYFPNPTIPDIQTPADPTAADATYCSDFNKKFITVDSPTGNGELLVDSVFGDAITVTDTGASVYRSMYVYIYSQPPVDLVPGRHITSFNGNLSKFVGFSELNFPIVIADDDAPVEPEKLPAPAPLVQSDIGNVPKLNGLDSAAVQVSGAVCPVAPANPNNDPTIQSTIDQWVKYNTFILGSVSCDSFTEFSVAMPSKVVGTFDPTTLIGKPVTVTGMLKNSSGQNPETDPAGNPISCTATAPCAAGTCTNGLCLKAAYNFWTIVIRGPQDLPQ